MDSYDELKRAVNPSGYPRRLVVQYLCSIATPMFHSNPSEFLGWKGAVASVRDM